MGSYQHNPWLIQMTVKLLEGHQDMIELLDYVPFSAENPPKFIRAQLYDYRFTSYSENTTNWWKRKLIQEYFPPLSLDNPSIQQFTKQFKS